jgi:hypothetical protein
LLQKPIQQAVKSIRTDRKNHTGTGTTPRHRLEVAATFGIALLAFVLSYSKLVGLAERAGYTPRMATLWPLIVDGLAVVATLAVLKLQKSGYAWFLLLAATTVSVIAAVASAVFPDGALPPVAAALVSVVPPLCLLVTPHLAVQLMRKPKQHDDVAVRTVATVAAEAVPDVAVVAPDEDATVAPDEPPQLFAVANKQKRTTPAQRADALRLITQGVPRREVARRYAVSDTTVRRWLRTSIEAA